MAPIKKLSPAELMQYMLWNEKLLNYLYATSISLQLTDQSILWPVSIFIWFVYIKFGCKGEKKKQNGVGNLRFHCFLHTNQSLSVYGWQADRRYPFNSISPTRLPCSLLTFPFWILTPKECISWAIRESSKNAITIIKV